MPWLVGVYEFTTPFSLKSSLSTSSGGKTNLIPTMYAIKMALIDASFRSGLNGEKEFEWIKSLKIKISPPKKANVQNAFVKIQKEARSEARKENPEQYFSPTVALREYIVFEGKMCIAFKTKELAEEEQLKLEGLMVHINQLGKRGCFVQLKEIKKEERLSGAYTFSLSDKEIQLPSALTVNYLDDIGEQATFSSISTYHAKAARVGRDRVLLPIGIPYQLIKSSRGFTYYERLD